METLDERIFYTLLLLEYNYFKRNTNGKERSQCLACQAQNSPLKLPEETTILRVKIFELQE